MAQFISIGNISWPVPNSGQPLINKVRKTPQIVRCVILHEKGTAFLLLKKKKKNLKPMVQMQPDSDFSLEDENDLTSGTLGDKNCSADKSTEALHRGKYTNVSNSTSILQKSHSPWLNERNKVAPTAWGTHMFFSVYKKEQPLCCQTKGHQKNIHHLLRGIIEVYSLLIEKGLPFQSQAKTEPSSHWQSAL